MYSDEYGLGQTLSLEEQAKADSAETESRMLATLRSGVFTTPTPTQLPEIAVTGSPVMFYLLLAVAFYFAFGKSGRRDLW